MSGTALEDRVAEAFENNGFIANERPTHVLAVKPNTAVAYLVECKDHRLSRKQQILAVRELNRASQEMMRFGNENKKLAHNTFITQKKFLKD